MNSKKKTFFCQVCLPKILQSFGFFDNIMNKLLTSFVDKIKSKYFYLRLLWQI